MALLQLHKDPSPRQLRQFTAALSIAAILTGYLLQRREISDWPWILYLSSIAIGVAGFIYPKPMSPIYLFLMYITYPLGWLLSNIVLITFFYTIITLTGILMRLLGRDALNRRFDRSARSYWVECDANPDPNSYFKQF